jgi:hypothetical protein
LPARVTDLIFQGTTLLLDAKVEGIGAIRAECPPAEVDHLNAGDEVVLRLGGGHLVPRESGAPSNTVE